MAQGLFEKTNSAVGNVAGTIQKNIYEFTAPIFTSTLSIMILTITLCVFVYTKIGKDWNREDFYKMGVWLVTYSIIYAMYSSWGAFAEGIRMLQTPLDWIFGAMKKGSALNLASGTDSLLSWNNEILGQMMDKWKIDKGDTYIYALMAILLWITMLLFILFIIIFVIIIKFAALLILSLCPIMLPCLVIQPLRSYFWSWFKLYVSTAMQVPMAYLIGGAIVLAVTSAKNIQIGEDSETLQVTIECLVPIIVIIIGIALLSKIPAWSQAIIGSGDGEHKTGITGAMASAGGMGMKGMKQFTKAGSDINHNTGRKNSLGRRMASAALATMGMEGMAQKVAGQNEGAKNARRESLMQSATQGAFTASATPHTDKGQNKK